MNQAGRRTTPRRSARSFADARRGLFRATLLFGSAALALSLIVVPEVDRRSKGLGPSDEVDTASVTGSIRSDAAKRWTLSGGPEREPCLMFPDGTQRGSC